MIYINDRELAIELIFEKLDNRCIYSYKEIAELTGFHPKYILKLKKEILDGTISYTHGNKGKKPHNAITKKEEESIITLYKRSSVNVKKFSKFYGKRSYSCIYSVLKKNNLI